MTRHLSAILTIGLIACGGSQPSSTTPASTSATADTPADSPPADTGVAAAADPDDPGARAKDAGEFKVNQADKSSRPTQAKLKATETHAAVRFFVVDKDKGPMQGIVISLTSPSGQKYYTGETGADGFAEVLVPIGKTYKLVYLSLGRRNIAAKVAVANEPNFNLKLTLRYKREDYATGSVPAPDEPAAAPRFVLDGVRFESGKAILTDDSHARLDTIVEYMTYKKSARIQISGHTDNVGKKKANKRLSQKRADAVRDYLVSKGIDASRIDTVGYGDERPIAPNDTPEGRQRNRRIEATEIGL